MDNTFLKGDRVLVNGKPGTVAYVRYAPPTYFELAAVSVIMDERKGSPAYAGTLFPANVVCRQESP